jgi:FlaA1/EpsC-like NDP-sugar epimerase
MKINQKLFSGLFRKSLFKRRAFFFITDILLISIAMYASFWSRFNGVIPDQYNKSLSYFILLALFLKLTFLLLFNLYDISWRFVSLDELIKVFKALSLSSLALGMALFLLRTSILFKASPFPRSILLIDYIFSLILIGSLRISKRVFLEGLKSTIKMKGEKVKILIVGAGSAGEQIIREMIRNKNSNYFPIGFVDDDPAKQGIKIHGIKVLGKREDIPQIIKNYKIDEALIALPSAHSKDIRKIVQIIREINIIEKIKILPSANDLIDGKVTLSDIHEVELEDLLGRAAVKIDFKAIKDFVLDKKVLVTGAGGSIGSELAKTILQFNPRTLIVLDIDETDIFHLVNNLKLSERKIVPVIGDIKDKNKMVSVFENYSPEIIVHSAAYKHVPVVELYPEEGVKTNILGTKIIAELSLKYDVEKFIFISTDKAINPASVMGATKRVGEELLKILNRKNKTKFISVRFGNVLGSRGSVIPLFKEQIKKGGPVTVTHPEMRRYFMSTSEAVLLVLEASAVGQGGEVFVLDMGEPIKILDLAKEMIRLSGYEPDVDIPIALTHIRPGEKLFEEILGAEEGVESTNYEKILKARDTNERSSEVLMEKIELIIKTSYENNKQDKIIKLLKEIVPTYKPSKFDSLIFTW